MALITSLIACSPPANERRVVGELSSDRVELSVEFGEPIVDILVKEGESVTKGQVLMVQDDARAQVRLAELEAALAERKARLEELLRGPRREQIAAARANVEGATHDLRFKESERIRIHEIHQRGLASADSLDAANAALDAAKANAKLRRAQLEEMLSGTTVEELAQAEQSVVQATARRDGALIDVARHTTRAPVAGVVDSRLFEIGERPPSGQAVLILLVGEQPYARVFVPEALRARLHTGSKASVYPDGLDSPLDGSVRWIASESAFTPYYALTERDRGRLSFVAKVDIAGATIRLPDGLPVEVEFLTNGAD